MTNPVNSGDPNIAQVAAALTDAKHAGGLATPYYRAAIESLTRVEAEHDAAVAECERLRVVVVALLKAYDEDTCCDAYGEMDLENHLEGCPFLMARDAVDAARKERGDGA